MLTHTIIPAIETPVGVVAQQPVQPQPVRPQPIGAGASA